MKKFFDKNWKWAVPTIVIVVLLALAILIPMALDGHNYAPTWSNWIQINHGEDENFALMVTHEQALSFSDPMELSAGMIISYDGKDLYEVITVEELSVILESEYGTDYDYSVIYHGGLVVVPHNWDGRPANYQLPIAFVREDWHLQVLAVDIDVNNIYTYTVVLEFKIDQ